MTTVAEQVPFIDLCQLCEKIQKHKKERQKYIKNFINNWRNCHTELHKDNLQTTDSFFPALRLLLPHCEHDRGAYGIKEHTLAQHFISIFCLDKKSPDAQKLLNFRTPMGTKKGDGDFASVAYFVLLNRCPVKVEGLKIHDINLYLDRIALAHGTRKQVEAKSSIMFLIRNTSAIEQKWLIRIILKNMRMGVTENSVLNAFHADAVDYYNVTNSLEKVCHTLKDPNVRLHEIEVSLFTPFRPMLSGIAKPLEVEKCMRNQPFVIETKFDGERVQLHKEGRKYMYFSRNRHDISDKYGGSPLEGLLTPHIAKCFKPNVSRCILDGEMVIYSNASGCIVSKGENPDIQALEPDGDYKPCFCVFDILLLNHRVTTNLPLSERIGILEEVFTPIEGKIQLSTRKAASTNEEVITFFNEAINNREEGIIIKSLSSVYKPNIRKNGGWLKIKPDYIDNLNDDLDLLIIGGYFGEGRRANKISHFLLGVAETSSTPGRYPQTFLSICKVGSGYSDKELDQMLLKLANHWDVYDYKSPPSEVRILRKERPEVWIKPSQSLIVQVKASEIMFSEKFAANCTLRFPRVMKIRYDKSWHECMTLPELEEMRMKSEGMLGNQYDGTIAEDEPSPKKAKRSQQIAIEVASQFRPSEVSNVKQVSNILSGKEFCIICSTLPTKKYFEESIVEHGGTFVQNPGSGTFCVIADQITLKVENIINAGAYDVVKTDWLMKCAEKKMLLPWIPGDMFHSTQSTCAKLNEDFDEFGDNFTEEATEDSLRKIFSNMEENKWKSRGMSNMEIADMEFNYFSQSSEYGLFRICRVYVDDKMIVNDSTTEISNSPLKLITLKLRLYGADITSVIDDSTTHIVVHSEDTSRLATVMDIVKSRKPKQLHIVTEKWINESIEHKNLLHEKEFQPILSF